MEPVLLALLLPLGSQQMMVDPVAYGFSRDFTREDPLIMGDRTWKNHWKIVRVV